MKKPKVLLIAPTGLDPNGKPIVQRKTYLPGLLLPHLGALTPDSVELHVRTETSQSIPWEEHFDLVGLGGMGGSGVVRAYQIAKHFRATGAKVVMGGIAVSLFDEEQTLEHVDVLVKGEADDLWPEIIEDFINDRLKRVYRMTKAPDVSKFPTPRYDFLNNKSFGFWRPVQATRGCPFPCTFCSISEFFKRGYRKRPVEHIIRDVRAAKASGTKYIAFIDDNIGVDMNYCRELWEALIPEKIIWISQCSLQIAENEDMLHLAYKSGCRILSFGVETINQASLTHVEKDFNKPEQYAKAFATIKKHGIEVSTEMIVGLDGDDVSVFERTYDFLMQNRIALPRIYILTPVPGTPMYRDMNEDGRIFDHDIQKYVGGSVVYYPKNMSVENLQNGYWKLYKNLYKPSSIIKRLAGNHAKLSPFMRMFVAGTNIVYQNHIKRGITPGIV